MNKKASILIVDDEEINIKVLEKALHNEYEIWFAFNGYDAIHLVKEKNPDLILLDVMMPGLSGFDVCKVIKADESFADIPVIFLTGMDTMAGEIKGLELGGTDYLTKPVNLNLLVLRVRNLMELKKRSDLIRVQRDTLARQTEELEVLFARAKRLEGIIPICMCSKKIRNDQNCWQQLEQYISDNSEARFSQGACPDCLEAQIETINNLQ